MTKENFAFSRIVKMAAQQRMAQLFKDLLRASNNFADYNFRTYFVRHVKATFEKTSSLASKEEIDRFIAEQEKNLEILERQSALSQAFKFKKLYYLKVLLEDADDEFDGASVVDLVLGYVPKRTVLRRQEVLEAVYEAIRQDVEADSQHRAKEADNKAPTEDDFPDLISHAPPISHVSKPPGDQVNFKRRQGRRSSSSSKSASEKEIDSLCQLFPQICRDELTAHLRVAAGDVNSAVERILAGNPTNQQSSPPPLDGNHNDVDLPRMTPEERLATMERYGLVDVSSSQTIHRPRLPTAVEGQQESRIRYLNNEVVDTTGKRYIEIKQDYPNMPKPVYLKAARKYRFH
ncbi:LYR motif-containing protein 4 [Sparganum proliferum]